MTTSLHLESSALGEFIELHEHDNHLRVRCGVIGRPCLVLHASYKTVGKARTILQRLHEEWLARGYAERAPSAEVIEGSIADELYCDESVPHPLLEPFLRINDGTWLSLRGQAERVALFRHGLRWQGDFDLERIAELDLYAGVVIDGNVDVSGVFSQLTYTYPGCILVAGDVRAASFGHGDSHMHVHGNVYVDNIVYGEYNDGRLLINGSVHGRAFISSDHCMLATGEYHLPVCAWDMDENWSGCLHPDLFEEGDDEPNQLLSRTAIRAFMHEGRDPFRPGGQPRSREPAPTAPAPPPPPSEFAHALRACVLAEDAEAITRLLETQPVHDAEWSAALDGRLCAPSTTKEQRARLLALKNQG